MILFNVQARVIFRVMVLVTVMIYLTTHRTVKSYLTTHSKVRSYPTTHSKVKS